MLFERSVLRPSGASLAASLAARVVVLAVATLAVGCRPTPVPLVAAPAPAPVAATHAPVHFAVIGDYGVDQQSARDVATLVHGWDPAYVVTTGDNNYERGTAACFDINVAGLYGRYIAFSPRYRGAFVGRGSAQQRFFPSLGNHDWDTPGARPYLDALALPNNGRYYTVRQGPVALFIVDSDRREPDGITAESTQGRWLRQALAESDAPHRLVVFHHPPFSVGPHGSNRNMRWPFAAWGATAVMSGHNHDYERYEVEGLTYIVNGIGGADLARLPKRCVIAEASFAHCVGSIYGAMQVYGDAQALTVRAVTTAGSEIDTFVLRGRPKLATVAPAAGGV